eukprot:10571575-Lingulodinium_polyedra.AAC.1
MLPERRVVTFRYRSMPVPIKVTCIQEQISLTYSAGCKTYAADAGDLPVIFAEDCKRGNLDQLVGTRPSQPKGKIAEEFLADCKSARSWANTLLSGLPAGADAEAYQAPSMLEWLPMPPTAHSSDALLRGCFPRGPQSDASKLRAIRGIGTHISLA